MLLYGYCDYSVDERPIERYECFIISGADLFMMTIKCSTRACHNSVT